MNRPTDFYVNDNFIADIFIKDTSLLTTCDISRTPLLGNLNIVNLTMCTQTGLYSASSLPKTISLSSSSSSTLSSSILTTKKAFTSVSTTTSTAKVYTSTTKSLSFKSSIISSLWTSLMIATTTNGQSTIISYYDTLATIQISTFSQSLSTQDCLNCQTSLAIAWIQSNGSKLTTVIVASEISNFSISLFSIIRILIDLIILMAVLKRSTILRTLKANVKNLGKRKQNGDNTFNFS